MELFATDLERLAFVPETDAALDLDFEGLEAAAKGRRRLSLCSRLGSST